jgi:hypothetical protein
MSSPTGGSSAPNVDKGVTKDGKFYHSEDGVAKGGYLLVLTGETLDARVKCNPCQMVTLHLGFPVGSINEMNEPAQVLRVYGCTVCGNIMTKRA